jgi:hypothetical protein
VLKKLTSKWTGYYSTYMVPGRVKNFLFSKSSKLALGFTQPPIQCVPGALSLGVKRLTTHLQLVQKSRKCGSIHPLPHTPSQRSA